ncbi:MAG: tRNA preQ1(34) S-adenosylmethionine ribosyltransferase-isomerase QueA [Spirochaetales bacterium]
MKRTDFSFDLPKHLIAQHPSDSRDQARLMVIDRRTGTTRHQQVADLPELLSSFFPEGLVMVFNDSRVRKARLYGHTDGDDRPREFLLLEDVSAGHNAAPGTMWTAMTQKTRRLKEKTLFSFAGSRSAFILAKNEMTVTLRFKEPLTESYFEQHGHVPLPPYIERTDEPEDESRYQTVYAKEPGSVAAPTAGLHFTEGLLSELNARGIEMEWVRLHVGIGTFLPVRVENVSEHVMHSEVCEVSAETADRLNAARASGKKILAVGTTSVRTLESAWSTTEGCLIPIKKDTDLFITPGYEFKAVDALFTNFHTPESTLLMLVSAFATREHVLRAYREAVAKEYRFFSYGDATLFV